MNLVPRFYDVTGGRILVDGVDIRDVTLASLRAQIGIVTQETILFDDSVSRNIAYGRPAASMQEIEAAARAAHAHEFIVNLAQGYDTFIGERGQRLSGGQRQRLAIARAILKDSPILVLDEATSSLDTESELLVQDALANLMKNRTSFVIAHRLSTIRRADAIIVMDRGRVVETGTPRRAAGARQAVCAALRAATARGTAHGAGGARGGDGRRRRPGKADRRLMIKSMTGFSSLTREDELVAISVTLRAVNHRYLDVQVRVPQTLQDQEARIRALLQQAIARGRVEVGVSLQFRRPPVPTVELNEAFVAALELALERARARGVIAGHLTPGDLLRLPHALSIRDQPNERRRRGRRRGERGGGAGADGRDRRARAHAGPRRRASARRPREPAARARRPDRADRASGRGTGQNDLQARLRARIAELTADQPLDRAVVAQEVVRMVGRSDISEEVTRFRAHLAALGGARGCAGAVRPQARFPAAGDEPRDQHHRLEGRRPGGVGARGDGEGRAREDARAGAECRVSAPGQLFIVSAPSGTGKTTLVERLVQVVPDLALSRSFTSRPPRAGECDGVDYNFITRERFDRMIQDGEFLEWADVFGNCYGTSASETDRILAAGHDLVLVIDVQGARQVRAKRADTIGIFVLPPTFAVLEERLRGRSKDTRRADSAPARGRAAGGRRGRRLRLRRRERRARARGRPAAGDRRGRARAASQDGADGGAHHRDVPDRHMALIALGVTGGIGAYKAVEVARLLQKQGHDVVAIMTRSARRFVGPVTFEAITRRRVITDQWTPGTNADIEHISIASDIALLLVAPATANIIGKFAHGIADDFLSSLFLATDGAGAARAGHEHEHAGASGRAAEPATLQSRGVRFVEPGEGYLACGWIGKGRLAEPADIAAAAAAGAGARARHCQGGVSLVTAGPTYEDLDPVRFVGNRSSGRMGYAIAAELAARGAEVVAGHRPDVA